jgi:NAD(P)-dependent dehydrogenase (short-subunit alcohol dehydrogenase family)
MPLPQKPVASPFDARTQALEVVRGIDLKGKTAIVTGASSGLGVETVRALASAGARVIMPVRSHGAGESAAAELRASTKNNAIEMADLDLGNYRSVRAFADAFVKRGLPLDLLINNAGIMATPERRIMGNIESSSIGHRRSPIKFDDPNFETTPYDKWEAYGQSKTANSLFAVELNRRLEPKGVNAYAVHPGGIMTNLQREMSKEEFKAFGWVDDEGKLNERFKTAAGGASTAVWCATSPLLAAGGGVYCEDCNIAVAVPADDKGFTGVRPWAIDPEAAKRLWSLSEKLLGETFAI